MIQSFLVLGLVGVKLNPHKIFWVLWVFSAFGLLTVQLIRQIISR